MSERILLGTIEGIGKVYLSKHSWDCEWYWGFGYLGNNRSHFHIESLISHPEKYDPDWTEVKSQFKTTWLTQSQWWVLRDLFIQAYAMKACAACYIHGGYQTEDAAPYRAYSKEMNAAINKDLGELLDRIWNLLIEWNSAVS